MAKKKQQRPYNAAGLSRSGVEQIVRDEEYKRGGMKGYPWSDATKSRMVTACDGLSSMPEILAKIHEQAARAWTELVPGAMKRAGKTVSELADGLNA